MNNNADDDIQLPINGGKEERWLKNEDFVI